MKIEFSKLHNTRDLGGMRTSDGRTICNGMLFRSGHLPDLDPSDAEMLHRLIRTIIDFRSDGERLEHPDTVIPDVEYLHIPIVDDLTEGISREEEADQKAANIFLLKPQEAREYMCGMYRKFTGEFAVKQYARFLRVLADAEGGVLWHCTAGKDRAGIAAVIVEEILGIPRREIIADYTATNQYLEEDIRFLTRFVKKEAGTDSELADEALGYLFGAEQDYIRSFYDAVDEKYGDFNRFLHDGLGVTDEMMMEFREKFTEKTMAR